MKVNKLRGLGSKIGGGQAKHNSAQRFGMYQRYETRQKPKFSAFLDNECMVKLTMGEFIAYMLEYCPT